MVAVARIHVLVLDGIADSGLPTAVADHNTALRLAYLLL